MSLGGSEGKAQRRSSPAGSPARSSQPLVEVDGLQLRVPLPDPSLELGLQAAHLHGAAGTRGAGDGRGTRISKPLSAQVSESTSGGSEGTRSPPAGRRARPYLFCGKSAQHSGVANTKLPGEDKGSKKALDTFPAPHPICLGSSSSSRGSPCGPRGSLTRVPPGRPAGGR